MSLEMIARTIQFILAPAVVVNACAVLMGGLLAHYATINDRLHALNRERLERLNLAHDHEPDALTIERLREIDAQVPSLVRRHRLVRDAALAVYGAILTFVLSMFVIAVAIVTEASWVSSAALIVFLVGALLLVVGVLFVTLELWASHVAIEYEVARVSSLGLSGLLKGERA